VKVQNRGLQVLLDNRDDERFTRVSNKRRHLLGSHSRRSSASRVCIAVGIGSVIRHRIERVVTVISSGSIVDTSITAVIAATALNTWPKEVNLEP